ncbi:hypothetical protein ACL6C3_20120 [Capilliphycus salinus ALCB114379]|uniref:hypothetical protein n=1 Tax=Capilliphycus salinus TaxID=2768948 RepID=UPI0039A6E516
MNRWVLYVLVFAGIVPGIIACQAESLTANSTEIDPVSTDTVSTSASPTPEPVLQSLAIYQNLNFGFQFNYSLDEFVVNESKINWGTEEDKNRTVINIWTQKHAQAIQSGFYEQGTEYPANVQITVESAPQKSLQEWIKQSDRFVMSEELKNTTIAEQTAIAFQSTGLYENQNIAFTSPDGSLVFVITLSQINSGDEDTLYKQVFEQVKNSFTFLNLESK